MRTSLLTALALFLCHPLSAALQVVVQPSQASPAYVGAVVRLNFSVTDTNTNPGPIDYRVEIATPSEPTNFGMVSDFQMLANYFFSQNFVEGSYWIRITARDNNYLDPSQYSQVVIPYEIVSRVKSNPTVTPTDHPLVALFSSPPCTVGRMMRVAFTPAGSSDPSYFTDYRSCTGTTSMNFLIAGLRANTAYNMNAQVVASGGRSANGPIVTWTSGSIKTNLIAAPIGFPVPFGPMASAAERLDIIGFDGDATALAVDIGGNIVWYYQGAGGDNVELNRLLPGGRIMTLAGYVGGYTGSGVWGNQVDEQVFQIVDLRSHGVQQTNCDRVNEQLLAMGSPDAITHFNHDARQLPDGNFILNADIQRVFPAGTQGSTAPVDIIGNCILELDRNLQLIWYWNSFDHVGGAGQLDLNRLAVLGEQCTDIPAVTAGCPPVLLIDPANDWLHTNSVQYQPDDGSLVISIRNQDWLAKIDFNNGRGAGNILWLMGKDGNFAINNVTGDPYPWFSHQHDAEFQNGAQVLTMFDNGNTRVRANGGHSRGYVLNVDEADLVVTPALLADLGVYSGALGSALPLRNGDYEFLAGHVLPAPKLERDIEVSPAGAIVFVEQAQALAYRAWRVTDFYNVPVN